VIELILQNHNGGDGKDQSQATQFNKLNLMKLQWWSKIT